MIGDGLGIFRLGLLSVVVGARENKAGWFS